ncbi:MAG TPA: winged helix-turn-helix domain-containing protein [Alphaproteobacteria bacterium]|nr:winged helix-turn-helix domain-containing protein [Alphaproteobacteria bacterium]
MPARSIAFGPFVLDIDRGTLARDGRPVALGHKSVLLLQAFLRKPGEILGKADLMDAAWANAAVEESNLSVQIAALRKVLGPAPGGGEWITTIPRVGYCFIGELEARDRAAASRPTAPVQPELIERRPSIAVLPFSNMSGDPGQEYLVDGLTEDIITALTRFRWFFVIARSSSFAYKGKSADAKQFAQDLGARYLLEGSVREAKPRLRISARLVDAESGNHLWAERYDLEMTEAFALQDEIAERVAGAIEPELLKTESARAVARHTGNVTAWDLVRQGTWHFHQVRQEGHLRARELFRQACALDPDLPEAHVWLARVSAGIVAYGWSADPESEIREGLASGRKAVKLDERNPYSHYALAIISAYSSAPDQAIPAAEEAVSISPSFALGYLVLGMAQLFCGHAAAAMAPLEHGLKLNPHDPQNFVWFNLLAWAQLFEGSAEEALVSATRAMKVRPDWRPTFETLAACYAALGKTEDARRCIEQMLTLDAPAGDVLGPLKRQAHGRRDQMAALLSKAGWTMQATP